MGRATDPTIEWMNENWTMTTTTTVALFGWRGAAKWGKARQCKGKPVYNYSRKRNRGGGNNNFESSKIGEGNEKAGRNKGTLEWHVYVYTYTPDAQIKLNTFLGKIPTKLFGVFGVDVLFFIIHYATLVCPRSAFTIFFFFFFLFSFLFLCASSHCTSLRTISTGSSY